MSPWSLPAAAATVALSVWAGYSLRPDAPVPAAHAQAAPAKTARQWAYIEKRQDLSPTESLSLVIIAHPRWTALDTRCLIYRDSELGKVFFTCPGSATEPAEAREQ